MSRSWSKSSLGPGLGCIDMKMTLNFCFLKTNYYVNLFLKFMLSLVFVRNKLVYKIVLAFLVHVVFEIAMKKTFHFCFGRRS